MKYYIGINITSKAIGYAVTNENYKLCKHAGKSMWAVRTFDEAKTAEDRRLNRSTKRRNARKKQRIALLQEFFDEDISKIDDTFFIRLKESRLHIEDKTEKMLFPLFNDANYTDKEFYRDYPTIYHLRKELMQSTEPHDPRLVYLACHHILKTRGHFLIEGSIGQAKDLGYICEQMISSFNEVSSVMDIELKNIEEVRKILTNKTLSASSKATRISKLFTYSIKGEHELKEKTCNDIINHVCKLIVGVKGNLKKIFLHDFVDFEEETSFKICEDKFEIDILPELQNKFPKEADVLEKIKAIYDWSVLSEILMGEEYLSFAKVKAYEEHKENLKKLKTIIRKYCSQEVYKGFFNNLEGSVGYGNYIGNIYMNGKTFDMKKCSKEDFYKELKKLLIKIEPEEKDQKLYEEICQKAENAILLPLARSKDNSVIPNQIHVQELQKILDNAKNYLPFLSEKDEYGTTAEKIIKIAKFRIPYFVGPLSAKNCNRHTNAWAVRKKEGRIYPWNFEEMIDLEKSNQKFIERMTSKCTYLIGEDVLPKNSLLYSKYMVLNELNNLKIRGNDISVKLKQRIYNDLFCDSAKVTGKKLLSYLRQDDPELELEDLSGFDENFHCALTSYMDFKKQIFHDEIEKEKNQKIIEKIIRWKTIYGSDTKMLKRTINNAYPDLFDEQQIKKILTFAYSGWGNFSEEFLTGITGADIETGECFNIMTALWVTNNNLMQLLSGRYTFLEELNKRNAEKQGEMNCISYESVVEDLIISPANKRAVWQTVEIVEEIRKIMKCQPSKIFINMFRGEDVKKRTITRKAKLISLYENIIDENRDWVKEIEERDERDFNSKKLYLYYLQKGRCMYTGKEINLSELMTGNSKWNIDHIYPQSKIRDDSIDNLVLVDKLVNAKEKDNKILPAEIRHNMQDWWKLLYSQQLLTKRKYERLTRTQDFTNEELAGFLEQQILETQKSAKLAAEVLGRLYHHSKIVYVKSGLVADFRQDNNIIRSKWVNDLYHAKDAYLNIIVGNVYNVKFTDNPRRWFQNNRNTNYSIKKVFDYNIYDRERNLVWGGQKDGGNSLEKVKKVLNKNDVLYTEYTYCSKGQLFNETIRKKGDPKLIRLKKELDPVKYGGYCSPETSVFAWIAFVKKDKRMYNLTELPTYIVNAAQNSPDEMEYIVNYLELQKGYENVEIMKYPIKKNSLIKMNGYLFRVRGASGGTLIIKNGVQLILKPEYCAIVQKVEKYINKNSKYDVKEEIDGFTHEQLNELYKELMHKLENKIYGKRPNNQADTLKKCEKNFIELEKLGDKAKIIYEIIRQMRCDNATFSDLKLIGGKASSGALSIGKNKMGQNEIILVHQSVTGIYTYEEVLPK